MKRKIAAVALCAVVVSSMVAPAVSVKAADKENLLQHTETVMTQDPNTWNSGSTMLMKTGQTR